VLNNLHRLETTQIVGMTVLFLGMAIAFYAIVQFLTDSDYVWHLVRPASYHKRGSGTFICPNHLAGYLEMVLPLSLALLFFEYGKMRRAGSPSGAKFKQFVTGHALQRLVLCLSVAVVLFAALLFSQSRMGIVAATVSLLVIVALVGVSRFHGTAGTLLATAFIALSIGLAIWIGPGPVVGRFADMQQEFKGNQTRLAIWQDARALVRREPVIGTGLGTFPIAYTAVQTAFPGQFVNHAHNDYLELTSDIGLPAALILFASILFILWHTVRTFFRTEGLFERSVALGCVGSIVAILLHSLTDFNLYIPANALLFSTVLGLAVAAGGERSSAPGEAT